MRYTNRRLLYFTLRHRYLNESPLRHVYIPGQVVTPRGFSLDRLFDGEWVLRTNHWLRLPRDQLFNHHSLYCTPSLSVFVPRADATILHRGGRKKLLDRRLLLDFSYLWLKPRPHQQQCRSNRQHCRSNIRLCYHKRQQCRTKFRPFDKVETNWTCSICFDFVERTKFRSNFDIVERIVQLVAFDNVASTLLLVWTGP